MKSPQTLENEINTYYTDAYFNVEDMMELSKGYCKVASFLWGAPDKHIDSNVHWHGGMGHLVKIGEYKCLCLAGVDFSSLVNDGVIYLSELKRLDNAGVLEEIVREKIKQDGKTEEFEKAIREHRSLLKKSDKEKVYDAFIKVYNIKLKVIL